MDYRKAYRLATIFSCIALALGVGLLAISGQSLYGAILCVSVAGFAIASFVMMRHVKCPHCGRRLSSLPTQCPHCGRML